MWLKRKKRHQSVVVFLVGVGEVITKNERMRLATIEIIRACVFTFLLASTFAAGCRSNYNNLKTTLESGRLLVFVVLLVFD